MLFSALAPLSVHGRLSRLSRRLAAGVVSRHHLLMITIAIVIAIIAHEEIEAGGGGGNSLGGDQGVECAALGVADKHHGTEGGLGGDEGHVRCGGDGSAGSEDRA